MGASQAAAVTPAAETAGILRTVPATSTGGPVDSDLVLKNKIEISLESRQVFYLFFGGAVLAALLFLLGIFVGKEIESRNLSHGLEEQRLASLDQAHGADAMELRFRNALASKEATPMGTIDERLGVSNARRMPEETGPTKPVVDHDGVGSSADSPAPAAASRAAAVVESRPQAAEAHANEPQAEAVAVASEAENTNANTPPKPRKMRFTLHLLSFRERAEADSFYSKIADAGYAPYIVEGEVSNRRWYRVRVGKYATYDQAIAAKKSFEAKQRIIAYVRRL